jgi:hypothetical protein
MELLPILASFSTGVPWLDHALRITAIVYFLYSIFLNVLVQVSPDAKDWTWVRVSLAMVANLNVIFTKILTKQEPAPALPPSVPAPGPFSRPPLERGPYSRPPLAKVPSLPPAPNFDPPTTPDLKTRSENPKPPTTDPPDVA